MNPRLPRRGPRSSHPDQVARPTLVPVRRRSVKAFLLEEWSLLLLAAALSIIVWIVVGEQVIQRHEIRNVEVELVVDPAVADQIDAVFFSDRARTTVTLNCSQREYDEAVRSLDRNGRRVVTLHVRTVPSGDSRGFSKDDEDRYAWGFDHNRILVGAPPPRGEVFKLESQVVRFATPETVPNKAQLDQLGFQVGIEVPQDHPGLSAPKGYLKSPIQADPLALGALVDGGNLEAGGSTDFKLAFSKWRSEPTDATEKAWRRDLDLGTVIAKVTLTQIGGRNLINALYFQGGPAKYEYEFSSRPEMEKNGVLFVADGLSFRGSLHGPETVLKQLEEPRNKHLWAWGIVINDPEELPTPEDKDESGKPKWKNCTAVIVWLPYGDTFRDQGVTFTVPERLDPHFDIQVRLRPPKSE